MEKTYITVFSNITKMVMCSECEQHLAFWTVKKLTIDTSKAIGDNDEKLSYEYYCVKCLPSEYLDNVKSKNKAALPTEQKDLFND